MPDGATLLKIGFRSTPMWWVEKIQPIKLGGMRATVGPLVKSTEWLKTADAESSDHDDSESDNSDLEDREMEWTSKHHGLEAGITDTNADSDQTDAPSMVYSTLARTEQHKQSTTDDLIDFEPLLPTPTPSISSCSASRLSFEPAQNEEHRGTLLQTRSQIHAAPENLKKKVFVPVGECQKLHVAELKTKGAQKQARSAVNDNKKESSPLKKQIEQRQRMKRKDGLMACKHAPSSSDESSKRNSKARCSIRRLECADVAGNCASCSKRER